MKILKIHNGTQECLVDDEDYERLSKFKWRYKRSVYRIAFKRGIVKVESISMAQEIMGRRDLFDHIDRQALNNQKHNLRDATYSQNAYNVAKKAGTSSRYKGVYWNRSIKKWCVRISVNRVRIQVGKFVYEDAAGRAYDEFAKKYHKEFAVLNFPDL